nr:PREDICTED: cytosol aminopeptidase-like isoform X3 [Bemisia tabaci]
MANSVLVRLKPTNLWSVSQTAMRGFASHVDSYQKGLVLGVYGEEGKDFQLTKATERFNETCNGKLTNHLKNFGASFKKGKVRILYDISDSFGTVALVNVGKAGQSYDEAEERDEGREAVRVASAAGCKSLQDVGVVEVHVESFGDSEAAAEGATLGLWQFQAYKDEKNRKVAPAVKFYEKEDSDQWERGLIKAEAQNFARMLMDTPGNLMTPTIFSQVVKENLTSEKIKLSIHDQKWAEEKKMGAFLSVTRGSNEPPAFLEISYSGGSSNDKPVVLVGKGVTFDSGGISIKPSASMDEMRADMGGAACVVSTVLAASKLQLPINLTVLTPLCENMPSGHATKPGDIVTAMNGKTIQVDNTDAEGRLILADALCYAASFQPRLTLDIATLTGAMMVAIGGAATGVFTNSSSVWEELRAAGTVTGDRVWRFPLWKHYTSKMTEFPAVDVNNLGKGKGGGACTAAAFLKEFKPDGDWVHMDMAGVMGPLDDSPYLEKGMSGRPTRTLIQFITQLSQKK